MFANCVSFDFQQRVFFFADFILFVTWFLMFPSKFNYFKLPLSDAYSEPCQTSEMENFAKIVNGYYLSWYLKTISYQFRRLVLSLCLIQNILTTLQILHFILIKSYENYAHEFGRCICKCAMAGNFFCYEYFRFSD